MVTLGDSIADGTVSIFTGPFGSALHSHDYVNEGVPVVPTEAIVSGRLDSTFFPKINREKADELARYELRNGDLVFARRGAQACGLSAMVDEECKGAIAGTGTIVVRINDRTRIDPKYFSILVGAPSSVAWLKVHAVGATMPNLNSSIISSLPVSFPPLPEQKAIARILGTLDDKIEVNRRMNATLEAIARALFQSWFVDFDPVHAKAAGRQPSGMDAATAALFPASFQDSELGEIPDGWNTTTLGSVLDVLETGRRPKGGVSGFASGIPSIGAESIWGIGEFDFGKTKFVPEEFFAKMSSGKVQHFDVLLYKDGGKPGEFRPRVGMFGHDFPFEAFGINEHVFRLRSSSVGQLYLYYVVADPRVLLDFANKGGKAAIPGINQQDVRSAVVLQPPVVILKKFNSTAAPLVDRILWNAKESRSLVTLRDTLLPKLLSGELSAAPNEIFKQVETQ
ncbi:restriction endonuclease S subunit [Opitutaceae bacterium TAV1]|nr:restriction endonuclease S subunit [Opitutaceae bacterium TAV1]